jgi:hypothetical protein
VAEGCIEIPHTADSYSWNAIPEANRSKSDAINSLVLRGRRARETLLMSPLASFSFTNDSSAFPTLVEYSVSYYTTFNPPYSGIEEYI